MTESEVAQLKRDTAAMALDYATAGSQYDELYDYLRRVESALDSLEYFLAKETSNDATQEQIDEAVDELTDFKDETKELLESLVSSIKDFQSDQWPIS